MCAVRAVLFDLDGTLTQSEEGIWNCVRYAAEKMGRPAPDAETLRRFIGPPLFFSFQTYMSMTEEEAGRAVDFYRERYNVTGLLENRVYPGIRRLLVRLKRAGCYLGIATGKPQIPTERILRHFRLEGFFDAVAGTRPEDTSASKEQLIRRALPATYAFSQSISPKITSIADLNFRISSLVNSAPPYTLLKMALISASV